MAESEVLYKSMVTPERTYYTPDELTNVLPLGRSNIYRGLKDGTIPSLRVGKKYVIPRVAIERWLATAGNAEVTK